MLLKTLFKIIIYKAHCSALINKASMIKNMKKVKANLKGRVNRKKLAKILRKIKMR